MDGGIVLDRKSFEALAVESRVRILKSLRQRRKTLSELAEEMKLSVSGVKEHLQVLERAELVSKMDDGHKWKYYELTKKGSEVVAPKELRVWILLSISTFALLMSMVALFYGMQPAAPHDAAPQAMAPATDDSSAGRAAEKDGHVAVAAGVPPEPAPQQPDPGVPLAVAGISAVTLMACMMVLWRNRARS
jgi:DNA-binding transcriptional ArsR family regulator